MHRFVGINGNIFRWGSHPSGDVLKKWSWARRFYSGLFFHAELLGCLAGYRQPRRRRRRRRRRGRGEKKLIDLYNVYISKIFSFFSWVPYSSTLLSMPDMQILLHNFQKEIFFHIYSIYSFMSQEILCDEIHPHFIIRSPNIVSRH
jgi:hypothetical protein